MLTDLQLQTLRAAMDTVIPPDDSLGAWDNGAGEYLLRQFSRDLSHLVQEYRVALDALDREAQTVYQQRFADLDADRRVALFTAIEAGEARAPWPVSPLAFLAMLINHTAEGYYSDPGQGGNLNHASWDMIGFQVTG